MLRGIFFSISIIAGLILATHVFAVDLTSTNFIISDPVIGTGGGYGTSTNFKAFSTGNINLSGTGSSTSFIGRYGFLYYPFVTDAVLTATPNGTSADLSWAASSAGLGWTVAGYNTGKASVSGGPYTYTDVGNVTSYSYTQLAPGDYCFVVQTYDNLGYVIATSDEDCVTISPVLTFDLDTSVSDSETNPTYTVSLGTVSVSDVESSGTTDSVNMVIVEGDTNAPNGVVVQVKNSNGGSGLVSSSSPADNINSSDGAMAAGTENYGLCVMTATLSGFSRAAPYNSGSCATNSNTNDIQALTTTGENILTSTSSPVYGAHAEISVNAAISGVTPAHTDYADTLTFIATSTF
jgi:hypothetical protein